MPINYNSVYELVCHIPEGQVATYGQIARLLNRPQYARQVGYALAALNNDDVPWHRVINAKGEISPRTKAGYDDYQRILLEDEGIEFNAQGKVDLARYQWSGDIPNRATHAGNSSQAYT